MAQRQMRSEPRVSDYEPVTRSKNSKKSIDPEVSVAADIPRKAASLPDKTIDPPKTNEPRRSRVRVGHTLTFIGVLFFTFLLYFRPYEFTPSLAFLLKSTFWTGVVTAAVFFVSELMFAGRLTALYLEVKIVLAFTVIALISVAFAISPSLAWDTFQEFVKAALMFIILVNVITTDRRLNLMFLLTIGVSCMLSFAAIRDYALGALVGERVMGIVGNLFDNPNALSLHLVTILPIVFGLSLGARNAFKKTVMVVCALLMIGGIFVSFSRGGFLGFGASMAFLAWKLRSKNRALVIILLVCSTILLVILIPTGQGMRILSIFNPSLDPTGSASQRQALLWRSIIVALRHPLLGIGIGNFPIMGVQALSTHNSYTQVASEMGMAALALYVAFIVTPFKGLISVERSAADKMGDLRYYYLAIGIQASLVAYIVSSFFAHVAYQWYVYYLVAYAVSTKIIFSRHVSESERRTSS